MIVNKVEKIVMSGLVLQLLWLAAVAAFPMDRIQAAISAEEIIVSEVPIAADDAQPEAIGSGSSCGTSNGCPVQHNGLFPVADESFSIRGPLTVDPANMGTVHFTRPPPVLSS